MNICTDSARASAQHLDGFRPMYEEHFQWLRQPVSPIKASFSLVEKASGIPPKDVLQRAKSVKEDRMAAKLQSSEALIIDHRRDRKCMGRHVYYAKCGCGEVVFLTAEELLALHPLGVGCLRPECSSTPARVRMWYHPEIAAALQIAQLDTLFPQRIPQEWRALTVADAAKRLLQLRAASNIGKAGQWWFQGLPGLVITQKATPLVERTSILCVRKPDLDLFPQGEVVVNVEGETMTASEVASALSVLEDDVINLKSQCWDSDLINELLERQGKNEY